MKMKLLSLDYLTDQAINTFRRFPYALSFATLTTFLACLFVNKDIQNETLRSLLMAVGLGVPIAIAATFFLLRPPRFWKIGNNVTQALPLLFVAIIFVAFHDRHEGWSYFQYTQFWISTIFFLTFAAFTSTIDNLQFWHFNRLLLLRAAIAAFFSLIIYLGTCGIIAMCDYLFKMKIDHKLYIYCFFIAAYLIFPWFFLAGTPQQVVKGTASDYNRFLKILVQYVLIPLVTIYFIILYLYALKIAVTWELPRGGVANLVCAASFFGIITLLLTYPIRNLQENRWIQFYSKIFYLALFPLVVLMSIGLAYRLNEYGITESRYLLCLYAIWLFCIAIYFTLSKRKNIQLIPISLSLIAFLTGFGPWGAGNVSLRNQQQRLHRLLDSHQLWDSTARTVKKGNAEIPFDERKQISSIFDYIIGRHGISTIEPMLTPAMMAKIRAKIPDYPKQPRYYDYRNNLTTMILDEIDVDYVANWETKETDTQRFNYYSDNEKISPDSSTIIIKNYDYLFDLRNADYSFIKIGDSGWTFRLAENRQYTLELLDPQQKIVLQHSLIDFVTELKKKTPPGSDNYRRLSPDEMLLRVESKDAQLMVRFQSLTGNLSIAPNKPHIDSMSAQVFVGLRANQKKTKR